MRLAALTLLCSAFAVSMRRVKLLGGHIQGRSEEALAALLLVHAAPTAGWAVTSVEHGLGMSIEKARRRRERLALVMTEDGSKNQPRLILTSTGLTSPSLESRFHKMLSSAQSGTDQPKRIVYLATPLTALTGQSETNKTVAQRLKKKWQNARRGAKELGQELGVEVECVDCSKDGQRLEDCKKAISTAQCIWVPGGNTFWLWYHMRRTGVDALVRKRVLEGGALYVGASAGAIVAGSTISTVFWKGWDDPSVAGELDADKVWADEANLRGMGLVMPDTAFFPHYNETFSELVDRRRSELDKDTRLVCLTNDDEVIYVSGEEETIAT